MSDEFDPYKAWLDIENKSASTTYYKLLGLPEFESGKDRITAAADKAIRKIRSQKPGEHLAEWQKIMDELQEIKALLLDDRKKDAYDEDLRFADEFVRELEGGIKRDPAGAAVTAAMTPKKSESRPVKQDPRYPPGMAPKSSSPPPPTKTTPDEIELKVSPGPKSIDRKDSPFYPPSRPAVDKAKPPAPEAMPSTVSPSLDNDMLPPGASTAPLEAAGPAPAPAPAYAPQPTQQPQPASYPQSPYQQPGGYPQQHPAYPQQPYPQPTEYPQNYYPPPGGPAPMAGYPGQPMAYPMQQPGYGYGPPMAQPMGYGAPAMPGQYGGGAPMAAPMYGAPMAVPMSPQGYMSSPPTPAALDPMAPVAIPGTAMGGGGTSPAPMAMPYGASAPTSVMMQQQSAPIPVGTAVATARGASPGDPSNTGTASASDHPVREIRGKSAAAVIMAAKKEKSSQQTLLFVGVGGLLLVIVAIVVFVAASGQFGNTTVATNPHVPAVTPDKTPPITVPPVTPIRPVDPPKRPELEKPASSKPAEPDKTKVPETRSKPEMPVETKPPETKPEPKSEPPKPDPPKPEPPKPEPPKPDPKPEPKPEVPAGEMPTKEEVVQLGKALKDAKDAIGEFNFADADADLAKADKLAKLPEHRQKLARLKEVGGYVKQFHDRLVQAATGMEGGETFKVGTSTVVAMVEANQKQVVLRLPGQNRTYQYSDLPVGLAAALADMKLEGSDPVSRVVKGSYVAVHRSATPDQLQMAKGWWEEATLGGANVTHLMPFLTDSYDLAKDFDKLKKSDAATQPQPKGDSEKGTTKPGTKVPPDARAILEGKTT